MIILPNKKKPTRFRKIYPIRDLIVNTLDKNQAIKRLMIYPTKNPLDEVGIDYNEQLIEQKDIDESLLNIFILETTNLTTGEPYNLITEQSLFKKGWQDRKSNDSYPTMYVSHMRTNSDLVGQMVFVISILIPSAYEELIEGNRGTELIIQIGDMFDKATVDREASDVIGDLEFNVGDVYESKITRSVSTTLIEIPITVKTINGNLAGR